MAYYRSRSTDSPAHAKAEAAVWSRSMFLCIAKRGRRELPIAVVASFAVAVLAGCLSGADGGGRQWEAAIAEITFVQNGRAWIVNDSLENYPAFVNDLARVPGEFQKVTRNVQEIRSIEARQNRSTWIRADTGEAAVIDHDKEWTGFFFVLEDSAASSSQLPTFFLCGDQHCSHRGPNGKGTSFKDTWLGELQAWADSVQPSADQPLDPTSQDP